MKKIISLLIVLLLFVPVYCRAGDTIYLENEQVEWKITIDEKGSLAFFARDRGANDWDKAAVFGEKYEPQRKSTKQNNISEADLLAEKLKERGVMDNEKE